MGRGKPLYDQTEDELIADLRAKYVASTYMVSPNDIMRELERRSVSRAATVGIVTNIVIATATVVALALSVAAFIGTR